MGANERWTILPLRMQIRGLHDRGAKNVYMAVLYELLEQSANMLSDKRYATNWETEAVLCDVKYCCIMRQCSHHPSKYSLGLCFVNIYAKLTKNYLNFFLKKCQMILQNHLSKHNKQSQAKICSSYAKSWRNNYNLSPVDLWWGKSLWVKTTKSSLLYFV